MVTTTQLRIWWADYRCIKSTSSQVVAISLFGRNAGYCPKPMVGPFQALERALVATDYTDVRSVWIPRECPAGIGGATCQPDGSGCTLHNYKIAVDIDPFAQGNPHFEKPYGSGWDFDDCKITRRQVDAVEAIRNVHGEQVFRWLGWLIGDTMHFEPQVKPSRTEIDWDTVAQPTTGGSMPALPITPNSTTEDIRALQLMLIQTYSPEPKVKPSGSWDAATAAAVKTHLLDFTSADDDDQQTNSAIDRGLLVNAAMYLGLLRAWLLKDLAAGTVDDVARVSAGRAHKRLDNLHSI